MIAPLEAMWGIAWRVSLTREYAETPRATFQSASVVFTTSSCSAVAGAKAMQCTIMSKGALASVKNFATDSSMAASHSKEPSIQGLSLKRPMMLLRNRFWYPMVTFAPWWASSWAMAHAMESSEATPKTRARFPARDEAIEACDGQHDLKVFESDPACGSGEGSPPTCRKRQWRLRIPQTSNWALRSTAG